MFSRKNIISWMLCLLSLFGARAAEYRLCLFSEALRQEHPSVVYDFLERYLFQLDSLQQAGELYKSRLMRDDVQFVAGNVEVCRQITPQTAFTLSLTDNLYYEATWRDEADSVMLDLVFPARYELICGQPKHKIERTLEQQLKAMPLRFEPDSIPTDLAVTQVNDSLWQREPIEHYEIDAIHDAVYFECGDNMKLTPLFDTRQPLYSAFNLLQGQVADSSGYRLYVEQSVYEFDVLRYTVSLAQWLNYCRAMHGKVYIGLEEEHEDGFLLLLLLKSPDLGFKHMLSLVVPRDFVNRPNAVLKAKLYAYIPIHNVKAYYKEKELVKTEQQ